MLCWKDQFDAPQQARIELAQVLLESGANPNVRDTEGRTAMDVCLDNKAPMALVNTIAGFADVNVKNRKGNTVFHGAIARGNVTFVRVLLSLSATTYGKINADLHAVDGKGRLPSVLAAY